MKNVIYSSNSKLKWLINMENMLTILLIKKCKIKQSNLFLLYQQSFKNDNITC